MALGLDGSLKCIEELARSPGGLTISEIAALAGFSRPAAMRLLEGLSANDIVTRDPKSKRYRLGLRLYEWVNAAVQATTPINVARREFVRLATETQRDFNFLVLEDLDVAVIECVEYTDGLAVTRPMPGRRAWHDTASGRAIVAFLPPAQAASILERSFSDAGRLEALRAEFESIRERGYGRTFGARAAVGVPVLGQGGLPVAAIGGSIVGREPAGEEMPSVVPTMIGAASRISTYLGHHASLIGATI